MKNINSLLLLDHRICKVQKLLSCLQHGFQDKSSATIKWWRLCNRTDNHCFHALLTTWTKKAAMSKFSCQYQFKFKYNENITMSNEHVQGKFLFQKLSRISNEYVQVKHFNEILIFSSNIVLLVVLFSLKNNFVLFDFKTANLKLTWFQVSLVSDLLFC